MISLEEERQPMLKAALDYAEEGYPVFKLRPGTKEPFAGSRCFHDATMDQETIRKWWSEAPDANIGIRTGTTSALVVLDLDTYKPGAWDIEDVERELGELPTTRTVRTGSGGLHIYFRLPPGEILRNGVPEGELGPGVCIKSDGGYVAAPPSCTTGTYEVPVEAPVTNAPDWIIRALRQPPKLSHGDVTATRSAPILGEGETIPEGRRNVTLASIAGRLHDGTRSVSELAADIMAINEARCTHPLSLKDVEKIARSIHTRTPCNPGRPKPTTEILAALDACEVEARRRRWGRRKTHLSLVKVLIREAREHSAMLPCGGVEVSLSYAQLALKAGVALKTVERFAEQIKPTGLVRQNNIGRAGKESGRWVLVPTARSDGSEVSTGGLRLGEKSNTVSSRAPLSAPRLRNSERYIRRLGKSAECGFDELEAAGGSLGYEELAAVLGLRRIRDLWRHGGWLERAVEKGVVEYDSEGVTLTADWLAALDRHRTRTGELAAQTRNRESFARKSDFYTLWLATPKAERKKLQKRPPSDAELEARAELEALRQHTRDRKRFASEFKALIHGRKGRNASELERVPALPASDNQGDEPKELHLLDEYRDLYSLIDKRVETTRGSGKLFSAYPSIDEIGVVLDSKPGIVTRMRFSDLEGPEVSAA